MLEVITQLEARYSLVIIDAPPLTVVPDAIPIANRVSGVLVVVREGKSTSTGARHLRKQLDNLKITPLGIIVNAASLKEQGGYYGYYVVTAHLHLLRPTGHRMGEGPHIGHPAGHGKDRRSLITSTHRRRGE